MITSSILFKNSGANFFWREFIIVFLVNVSSWDFFAVVPNPTPEPKSWIFLTPKLDVIIITQFVKSIFLPRLSVKKPSSKTCRSILKISGWAFSISSSKTTAYGFLLIFSVNWPPSSYPTYPGGAPINLDTANFSIYSLISTLIKASSLSNNSLARIFASCVFPTPVCPRNMNEPIGFLGSFNPALFLWIDLTTFSIALSWPIIFSLTKDVSLDNLLLSDCFNLFRGIPVIIDTTSAILSSLTISLFFLHSSSHWFWAKLNLFSIFFSLSLKLAASSYFWFLTAVFFLSFASSNSFSSSWICWGTSKFVKWTLEPASSKASIALSGRCLSVMYLEVNFTHANKASSV